jgi:hypothetical protein
MTAPTRLMKVRHELRSGPSASLVQALAEDRSSQYQVVALYDPTATKGSRPIVVFEVDATADLSQLEQGAEVTVRGWPVVGRAVILDMDGELVEPTYPCTSPVFRAMRLK